MANFKKTMMAAAGAGGAGLNVEEVFSIDVFAGNSSSQTINNGIDFANEGGLFWNKSRTGSRSHHLSNTETGVGKHYLVDEGRQDNVSTGLTAFNSNGVSIGNWFDMNRTTEDHANWSFRNCPKFFQVIRYTGNGTAGRTISHDLGSNVGCMAVHSETNNRNAYVWHRGLSNTSNGYVRFRFTDAEATDSTLWNGTAPTSTTITLGTSVNVNSNGEVYIMYLWAHNNGDGNFGPNGDADIIKCGTFTSDSSGFGQDVNLGWEPQFLIVKRYDSAGGGDWKMIDTLRGYPAYKNGNSATKRLQIEESSNEGTQIYGGILSGTGFKIQDNANADYLYIAIRRGPMAVPESATEVFAMDTYGGTSPNPPTFNSGFPVDMGFYKDANGTDGWQNQARLIQGKNLVLNTTGNEGDSSVANFDYMDGYFDDTYVGSTNYGYMWKRAPGYFDVVAYTGTGSAGRTVSHNLGVAPEMMWVKNRNTSTNWAVYHKDADSSIPQNKYLYLNTTGAVADATVWNDTAPTDSQFTVGSFEFVNQSNANLIAYLFASLPGISKVGSYTGNGTSASSTNTIDCGFSSGARFVLCKRTNAVGNWVVFDTARGIVSGSDSFLYLNLTNAEVTDTDVIDPHSSGFTLVGNYSDWNANGGEYIFYAIA